MIGRTGQPERDRGTARGVEDRVAPGWADYSPSDTESHAAEVHYDVLRRAGFDVERAREIAARSSSEQGHLLESHRGEQPLIVGTSARARRRARVVEQSGYDIRDHMAGIRDDQGG